jgi:hypothetical protein
MTRKPYYKLIQARIEKLLAGDQLLYRVGKIKDPDSRPSIEDLGDVFKHIYEGVEQNPEDPIARAFEACDLDLDNPFHWEQLLRVVCELHFCPKKKQPTKRTPEFKGRLDEHREILFSEDPEMTQVDQAKKLKDRYPEQYKDLKVQSLRRIISERISEKKARSGLGAVLNLSQMIAAARWIAARKFLAVLS